jgi:hypothetical protein
MNSCRFGKLADVQRYAPVLNLRIRRELRRPNRSWRVDETYVKAPMLVVNLDLGARL